MEKLPTAKLASGNPRTNLTNERVKSVHVRHGSNPLPPMREFCEPLGNGDGGGKRLLANDVCVRSDCCFDMLRMHCVGSADVDDIRGNRRKVSRCENRLRVPTPRHFD